MCYNNPILLIEDDDNHAEIFEFFATQQFPDIHIKRLSDGEEAINYIKNIQSPGEHFPSLIVLDLNLPRFSGLEVLEMIKSHPLAKRVPTVIFTSSSSQEEVSMAWSKGANSYLRKPIEAERFKPLIKLTIDYWQSNETDKEALLDR